MKRCFYSKLVRLKVVLGIKAEATNTFLFQIGAIKRATGMMTLTDLTMFLFQIGAIKSRLS